MKSLLSVVALAIVALCSAARPKGFVTTKGRNFVLDGKPFAFVGANSYWLPLLTNQRDINATFQEMQDAGIKVLRTWGFNAINATELPFALESNLTYYQVWNGSDWTLNDGPQGLERLDNVIATAGRYDIKVILAFTNNWIGYGGSELYINWIAGSEATHDVFYSHPDINKSYQRYVKTIVNRYKDSSNIFAWELMNEARCRGDLPGSSACDPKSGLISKWYKKQSDFVRNLPVLNILSVSSYITKPIMLARDQHHLITTGGEGQFNWKHPKHYWYNGAWESDYNYNGQAGEDFDKDLNLRNIDFGTYHMYPTFWYSKLDTPGSNFSAEKWGLEWIEDHAKAAQKIGKPLILEEFGHPGLENKTEFYPSWVGKALKSGHSGIMPWQFGMLNLTEYGGNRLIKYADAIIDGASPNDGFTYYKNQTAVWSVFTSAAEAQNRRSWIV